MEKEDNREIFAQKSFFAFKCSTDKHDMNIKEKIIEFISTQEGLTIGFIINLIHQSFQLKSKKITLYDWKGIEIIEDADLLNLLEDNDTRALFFIRKGDVFDNRNILRLFSIGKQLGEGGFGQVYLATMKTTMKPFAIKFLKHHKTDDIDYLFREINLLLRLKHENIIKLYSYFATEEGRIALIMEYALGGTLKNRIKAKGGLDEDTSRTILLKILRTVGYCHDEGVIHRDLKTDNILFKDSTYKQIKVIDFGISTLFNTKSRAGSLAYLSPEVLSGTDSSSLPSVDIWAIGCILFEMVTGSKMFDGKSNDEIRNKIIKRTVNFPKYLSIECVNLIDNLTTLNPGQRITIEQALYHPWIRNEKLNEISEIAKAKNLLYNKKKLMLKKRNKQRPSINDAFAGQSMNLITKVNNINEDDLFYYDLSIMQNIPGYMMPIGNNRKRRASVFNYRNCNTIGQMNTTKTSERGGLPSLNFPPIRTTTKTKTIKLKHKIKLEIEESRNNI